MRRENEIEKIKFEQAFLFIYTFLIGYPFKTAIFCSHIVENSTIAFSLPFLALLRNTDKNSKKNFSLVSLIHV